MGGGGSSGFASDDYFIGNKNYYSRYIYDILYLSQATFTLLLILYFFLNTLCITSSSRLLSSYTENGER